MRPLQNLHRLATPNGQLVAVASRKVMDHYRQLTAARKLRWAEKEGQQAKPLGPTELQTWLRMPPSAWNSAVGLKGMFCHSPLEPSDAHTLPLSPYVGSQLNEVSHALPNLFVSKTF